MKKEFSLGELHENILMYMKGYFHVQAKQNFADPDTVFWLNLMSYMKRVLDTALSI